jgi:prepilin-type processing-associated H-X9-DG protein
VSWGKPENVPVTSKRIGTFECPSSPSLGTMDHEVDGDTSSSPWTPLVAVSDYGVSLGNAPGLRAPAQAAYPSYYPGPPVQPVPINESKSWTSTATDPTNGLMPKNAKVTFGHVTDGLTNTIAMMESAGRPYVYRRGQLVSEDLSRTHLNAGGWARAATDILFAGSNSDGTVIPGAYVGRTNGHDVGPHDYANPAGYPAPYGTEGSSQPFSFHNGGMNIVFADGRVAFIGDDVHIGVFAALVTRNGAGSSGTAPNVIYKEPLIDAGQF